MWTKENMPGQTGKTVIVTGANTGIGYETALAFYEHGAHVVIACRDREKGEKASKEIVAKGGTGSLEVILLDLASLDSVKQFATQFISAHNRLHILVNNAGVMYSPAAETEEGYELQFGVNFLGHFALTGLLYPLLQATPDSRVVTVSSMAYLHGSIDFGNLRSEKSYDPVREYCRSKFADIVFAVELQRRIEKAGDNIISLAAQPGANKTELSRHMSEDEYAAAVKRVGDLMEPWQGALPQLYAATMPDAKGAELYSPDQDGGYRGYPARLDIIPPALGKALGEQLWNVAEEATNVRYSFGIGK